MFGLPDNNVVIYSIEKQIAGSYKVASQEEKVDLEEHVVFHFQRRLVDAIIGFDHWYQLIESLEDEINR